MGNACTSEGERRCKALRRAIRDRERKEDAMERNLDRQLAIYDARQKAMTEFYRRDEEEEESDSRRDTSSFDNGESANISNTSSEKDLLCLKDMMVPYSKKAPTVICFNSELKIEEASPAAPAFVARDHMGRQMEVLVPNPSAGFYEDEDRFLPFFHPNSPLSCEAVMLDTEEDELKKPSSSRRLRFLEKSEDVQEHLKRMAPVNKAAEN